MVNLSQKSGEPYSPLNYWKSTPQPHEARAVVGKSGYSQHGTEMDLKRNERGSNGGSMKTKPKKAEGGNSGKRRT